jgi:hypothetical protein
MNDKMMHMTIGMSLAGLLLLSAGCVRVELPKPDYTESGRSVQVEGAEKVSASFEMGAGTLAISGGGTELMDATFGYTDPSWEPTVVYEVKGTQGALSVRTPTNLHINFGADNRFEWDIKLGEGIPLDLSVAMGAGESTIDLSGLDVRRLQVDLGAGESTIDLSGAWSNDLVASINAGVGLLNLKVPEGVGVRIAGATEGIGDYQADGFKQDGAALVNDAYGTADVTFEIALNRGVGEIVVETVP